MDTDTSSKGGGAHHTIVRAAGNADGQAMAEYAVILTFVAATVLVAYQLFGQWVAGLFQQFVSAI